MKLTNNIASIKRMLVKNASRFGVDRSVFRTAETRWCAWAYMANVQQTYFVAYASTELAVWRALATKVKEFEGR